MLRSRAKYEIVLSSKEAMRFAVRNFASYIRLYRYIEI